MSGTWISTAAGSVEAVAWSLDSLVTSSPATPAVRASGSGTESDECSWQTDPIRVTRPPSAEVPIASTPPSECYAPRMGDSGLSRLVGSGLEYEAGDGVGEPVDVFVLCPLSLEDEAVVDLDGGDGPEDVAYVVLG